MLTTNKKKSAQPSIVIFLHRTSITFIAPELELLQVFPLSPETVTNLNVVQKDELSQQLENFISQIGLQPGNCVLIFDPSVYFLKESEVSSTFNEKDSEMSQSEQSDEKNIKTKTLSQTERFVKEIKELAPYENAFVKDIIIGSAHYTIMVNRNFYEPILSALTELGFFISTLIPSLVIEELLEGQQFSLELGKNILKSGTVAFKKHNFLSFQPENNNSNTLITRDKPETKKIVALVAVFVILIGVLIFMVMNMEPLEETTPISQLSDQQTVQPTLQPMPSTSPAVIASESAVQKEEVNLSIYTIQIFNGSGKIGQAAALKELLLAQGFEKIETGNTATLTSSRAVVIFNASIPENVKQLTSQILVDAGLSISPITSNDTEADIVITTVTSSNLLSE